MSDKKVYTVKEVMDMLNVCRQTVYRLMFEGAFAWRQIGNGRKYIINKESFDAWLKNSETEKSTVTS